MSFILPNGSLGLFTSLSRVLRAATVQAPWFKCFSSLRLNHIFYHLIYQHKPYGIAQTMKEGTIRDMDIEKGQICDRLTFLQSITDTQQNYNFTTLVMFSLFYDSTSMLSLLFKSNSNKNKIAKVLTLLHQYIVIPKVNVFVLAHLIFPFCFCAVITTSGDISCLRFCSHVLLQISSLCTLQWEQLYKSPRMLARAASGLSAF